MTSKQSSKLLIEESPLQVLPTLAATIGLNEAIFLQQLQYWLKMSKHEHDGRKWIYNSIPEWLKQFPFWSESTLKRIVSSLRDMNIVITRSDLNKENFDRTLWYAIDYDALDAIIPTLPSGQNEPTMVSNRTDGEDQNEPTNTNRLQQENTTETTPETPPSSSPPRSARERKKKEPAPPKLSAHPLIQAFRETFRRYPNHGQIEAILKADPPIADWVRAIREWNLRGNKPTNVKGMLEWALNPALMERFSGNTNSKETMRNGREADNGQHVGPDENGRGWYPGEIERIQQLEREGRGDEALDLIRAANARVCKVR